MFMPNKNGHEIILGILKLRPEQMVSSPVHLLYLGDNCSQNFHFGRNIVIYGRKSGFTLRSNASLQFRLKLECYKPQNPTICDVINDVKLFSTVTNFRRYSIRRCVTNSSALELDIYEDNSE